MLLSEENATPQGTPEAQLWLRQIVDELGDLDAKKAAQAFSSIPTAQEASILEYMTLAKEDAAMIPALLSATDDDMVRGRVGSGRPTRAFSVWPVSL